MRREFTLVLLAGAAGAGLVVLAVRQAWAHAVFTPPRPLPAQDITVTGQQLVPLAGALALAVLGAGAAAAVLAGLRAQAVLAAARASAVGPLGGSTTSGASSGGAVHEIVTAGRGPRWPVMSARYERSAPPNDSANMWESLSRDVDPTVDDGTRT